MVEQEPAFTGHALTIADIQALPPGEARDAVHYLHVVDPANVWSMPWLELTCHRAAEHVLIDLVCPECGGRLGLVNRDLWVVTWWETTAGPILFDVDKSEGKAPRSALVHAVPLDDIGQPKPGLEGERVTIRARCTGHGTTEFPRDAIMESLALRRHSKNRGARLPGLLVEQGPEEDRQGPQPIV